jgi:hypothetical protein
MDEMVEAGSASGTAPGGVEAALSDASRALLGMIDRAREQALETLLQAEREAAAIRAAAHDEANRHLDGVAEVLEDSRRRLEEGLRAAEAGTARAD